MEEKHNLPLFEIYRKKLQRIGWRIQYLEKVKKKRELISENIQFQTSTFVPGLENKIYISQLINSLPSVNGQRIIRGIFLEGKTETEVAKELKISQQGVNKCKTKMLRMLYQTMNSRN